MNRFSLAPLLTVIWLLLLPLSFGFAWGQTLTECETTPNRELCDEGYDDSLRPTASNPYFLGLWYLNFENITCPTGQGDGTDLSNVMGLAGGGPWCDATVYQVSLAAESPANIPLDWIEDHLPSAAVFLPNTHGTGGNINVEYYTNVVAVNNRIAALVNSGDYDAGDFLIGSDTAHNPPTWYAVTLTKDDWADASNGGITDLVSAHPPPSTALGLFNYCASENGFSKWSWQGPAVAYSPDSCKRRLKTAAGVGAVENRGTSNR